jgi:hypothetical protein
MALNPIPLTERLVDDFLHYQLTTYPLAESSLFEMPGSLQVVLKRFKQRPQGERETTHGG